MDNLANAQELSEAEAEAAEEEEKVIPNLLLFSTVTPIMHLCVSHNAPASMR